MAFPTQSANLVNASDQYFSRASFADITGNLTVETWIKWTGTVGAGAQQVVGKDDDAASGGGGTIDWGLRLVKSGSDTIYVFSINNGSYDESAYTQTGVQTLFDGSWHHLAAVYTAANGSAEFFLDGVSVGTGNTTAITSIRSSTRKLFVGVRGTNAAEPLDPEANLVMMRIWSTTRTASQLSSNWCAFLGATTNLVSEYGFNGVATDNSGNGNDLTAVNTPTYDADVPATCATVAASPYKSNLALLGVG